MHYSEHPVFTPPSNPNATIWRYMDFTKLVSMLETKALYFARADTLNDPFEGSVSEQNINQRELLWPPLEAPSTTEGYGDWIKESLLFTFVSCWNEAEYESAALWGLYVPPTGGVAIKSNFRCLTEAFGSAPDDEEDGSWERSDIFIGTVRYMDYKRDTIPDGNIYSPFVHKRRSFEFEHELRAVFRDDPPDAIAAVERVLGAGSVRTSGPSGPCDADR